MSPRRPSALTGLEGFVTLVNDPTQIRAFYSLHKGLEESAAMLSFEQTMLADPGIRQLVDEQYEPPPYSLEQLLACSLIAAVARNGAIGRDNELLWKESADQKHFAATTRGHAVIMGRKTWESLPPRFRPLPGRRNIVVTRNAGFDAPGAETVDSLEAALQRVSGEPLAFVIGGAQLYAQALPLGGRAGADRDRRRPARRGALPGLGPPGLRRSISRQPCGRRRYALRLRHLPPQGLRPRRHARPGC